MSEDNSSERADLNQLVLDLAPHGESVAQLFKNELARAPWIVWSPERRDIIPPSGMPDSRWGFPSGPISDSMW